MLALLALQNTRPKTPSLIPIPKPITMDIRQTRPCQAPPWYAQNIGSIAHVDNAE
jgi:hypothetical protein